MFDPAVIWLCVLLLGCLIYCGWLIWHNVYDFGETLQYVPVYIIARLLWRVGFTNEPPQEIFSGAILAANHRSSIDPLFVQLAARRRVHWMVAKEYCQHFLFGFFLRKALVIPTNRSGMDLAATKQAMNYALQGKLVGMFPEGRINLTVDPLLSIRAGAALVAVKTGVPVIPIYIQGSPYRRTVWSPFFMAAHVRITFGKPIFPPARPDCTATTNTTAGNSELSSSQSESSGQWGARSSEAHQQAQQLIFQWGEQLLELAGCKQSKVTMASDRRAKREMIEPESA
jgi:1-acyl-sn-glycerol-3-phosphate acyltransferase